MLSDIAATDLKCLVARSKASFLPLILMLVEQDLNETVLKVVTFFPPSFGIFNSRLTATLN